MEHGEEVFRHDRILGVEDTGTSQNAFPPVGRRIMLHDLFSGKELQQILDLTEIRKMISIFYIRIAGK